MKFILGEKREVKINISSTTNDPFTIRNATCDLIKRIRGTKRNVDCTIEGTEISTLIQLQEDGSYILEFTYEIANEILKANIPIEVVHNART